VTLVTGTAACGGGQSTGGGQSASTAPLAERQQQRISFPAGTTMAALSQAQKIRVGTKFDQPGFGLKGADGKLTGFDVEIAKLIAGELGIPADKIEWVPATSKVREEIIEQGKVDIVVATYTITDARKQQVDFAGPYFVAGQQIMTRKGDTSIKGPESFKSSDQKVCSVAGSTPAKNIVQYLKNQSTQLVLVDGYPKCIEALKNKQVDAVTTDNVVLSGFLATDPDAFQLVGTKFTEEPYGIGLKKGDTAFRAFINDVLETIAKDGRYLAAWNSTVGKVDPRQPAIPAINRY
jgi:ABC-type amino acid transport/signal transduction systems, periplasmic component/domain